MSSIQWREPRLVQRLKRPLGGQADSPWVGAGLSANNSGALGRVCRLDYMGAAEFEYGAVGKCLKYVVEKKSSLATRTETVCVWGPTVYGRDEQMLQPFMGEGKVLPPRDVEVYFLGQHHLLEPLANWVRTVDAVQQYPGTKEMTCFQQSAYFGSLLRDAHVADQGALTEALEPYVRALGWMVLELGVMYFTDKTMFKDMCALFGVRVAEPA